MRATTRWQVAAGDRLWSSLALLEGILQALHHVPAPIHAKNPPHHVAVSGQAQGKGGGGEAGMGEGGTSGKSGNGGGGEKPRV